ncbi:hypothetical protein PG996_011113 [Apiospora saccharicola]|uniref:Uncharacterized protein n=1 Tax=Apiospora saccharicola TaxID=335842 RepID=A0ABR1UE76_9PEZI
MHYPNKKQKGNPNVVETKDFVSPLRGMYNMQVSRERPVTVRSMLEAIRYERNSAQLLRQVAITFRPAMTDLFGKSESYNKALKLISRRANGQYHSMFENTRAANFFVLMCGFEDNSFWVAIIMHLTPQKEGSVLADHISIIDPYPTNRDIRSRDIKSRLETVLAHGNIQITAGAYRDTLTHNDIPPRYGHRPTGLVVFAIVCEFMRRVAVSKFLGRVHINPCQDLDMIFGPFQQNYNFDAYRRRIAAACANQAIELSNYQGRLAIELPGYDENNPLSHDPIAVAPPVYKEQGGNRGGGGDAGGPSGSGNEKENPIVLDAMDGVELDENDLRMESLDDLMELDNPGLDKGTRMVKMSYEAIRKPETFGLNKVLGGVKKGVSKVQKGVKKQQSKLAKKYDSLSHKLAVGDYQAPLVHEIQSPIEEIQTLSITSATAPQIPPGCF